MKKKMQTIIKNVDLFNSINLKSWLCTNFYKLDAPLPWQMNFQHPATPTMEGIVDLHHNIMFFMIFIVIFISYILIRAVYLFNDMSKSVTDPVSNTRHFLLIEIIWTIIPLVILFWIALPSFALLYSIDHCSKIELTMKVIGRQWYWTYEIDKFIPKQVKYKPKGMLAKYVIDLFRGWNTRLYWEQRAFDYCKHKYATMDHHFEDLIKFLNILQTWSEYVLPQIMYKFSENLVDNVRRTPLTEDTLHFQFKWVIDSFIADPETMRLARDSKKIIPLDCYILKYLENIDENLFTLETLSPIFWTNKDWIAYSTLAANRTTLLWLDFIVRALDARFRHLVIEDPWWRVYWIRVMATHFVGNMISPVSMLGIDFEGIETQPYQDNFADDGFYQFHCFLQRYYYGIIYTLNTTIGMPAVADINNAPPFTPYNGGYRHYRLAMWHMLHIDERHYLDFKSIVRDPQHLLHEFDSCIVSDNEVYKNFVKLDTACTYWTPNVSALPTTFCGWWRLLEVDNRLILPIKLKIRMLVTSSDVIHSWAVPSLGIKIDACPGRLNCVYTYIKRPGVFHGQCSELCGVKHGFMPIVVHGVTREKHNRWFAKNCDLLDDL